MTSTNSEVPSTAWRMTTSRYRVAPSSSPLAPGRRRVILPEMTAETLAFIAQVDVATACQVFRRFRRHIRSPRTCRHRLLRLCRLGLLRCLRFPDPSIPHVYRLSPAGSSFLRERGVACTARPPRERSLHNTLHELAISEVLIAFMLSAEASPTYDVVDVTRHYHGDRRLSVDEAGTTHHLAPDAGVLVRATRDGRSAHVLHLLEHDAASVSLARMEERFRRYHLWGQSDVGREHLTQIYREHGDPDPHSRFRLCVICQDPVRGAEGDRRRLVGLVAAVAADFPVWFATAYDLASHQADPCPLNAPVWIRPHDLAPHRPKFNALLTQLPNPTRQQRHALARRFIAAHINELPRHRLF